MERRANPDTWRFVEDPDDPSSVIAWFQAQEPTPEISPTSWGAALVFPTLGAVQYLESGAINGKKSPVVTVHLPMVRRRILWTVGEVNFLPRPLEQQFPKLNTLRKAFVKWFTEQQLVYSPHPAGEHEFDYYLEGTAMNEGPIRAFPSGLAALKGGRYFVSWRQTDGALSTLRKKLLLRGVDCPEED